MKIKLLKYLFCFVYMQVTNNAEHFIKKIALDLVNLCKIWKQAEKFVIFCCFPEKINGVCDVSPKGD